jgi:hypothetical protein
MAKSIRGRIPFLLTAIAVSAFGNARSAQQGLTKLDLDRSRQILRDAYDNVKKNYYDVKFHGLD